MWIGLLYYCQSGSIYISCIVVNFVSMYVLYLSCIAACLGLGMLMALLWLKLPLALNCKPVSFESCCQVVTPNIPDIQVIPPDTEHLQHIIDSTAMYVLDDGCAFEQAVMERGRGNPLFNFLFDLTSSEHTYYIWRLYSFAQVITHACADCILQFMEVVCR